MVVNTTHARILRLLEKGWVAHSGHGDRKAWVSPPSWEKRDRTVGVRLATMWEMEERKLVVQEKTDEGIVWKIYRTT